MDLSLRLVVVAAALVVVAGGCRDSGLTASERRWAEQATLEVARINDVMALEFLPAQSVTGDPNDGSTPGGPGTDWNALAAACGHLADEELQRDPSGAVPERFVETAKHLAEYQRAILDLGTDCAAAANAQDGNAYKGLADGITAASRLLRSVDDDIPDSMGCPDDAPDRPATCDD